METTGRLNGELLLSKGWVSRTPGMWTFTKEVEGNKFRLGWNENTHKFYIGYGELPVPVESVGHLLLILHACGLHKEANEYGD